MAYAQNWIWICWKNQLISPYCGACPAIISAWLGVPGWTSGRHPIRPLSGGWLQSWLRVFWPSVVGYHVSVLTLGKKSRDSGRCYRYKSVYIYGIWERIYFHKKTEEFQWITNKAKHCLYKRAKRQTIGIYVCVHGLAASASVRQITTTRRRVCTNWVNLGKQYEK